MDKFIQSLPKLPDGREMGAWDKAAITFGIPENMLMENAGRAVLEAAKEKFGASGNVCLFMGAGNNGGDAACVARHLKDDHCNAAIYCTKAEAELRGAAAWHLDLAKKNGAKFYHLPSSAPDPASFLCSFISEYGAPPDLIVDALLGTGFEHELRPDLLKLVKMINELSAMIKCPVLSVDIPSGLNPATGLPMPEAVRADLTVTLAAAKPGLLLPHARAWTGELVCRPIGLPAAINGACPARFRLLDGSCLNYAIPEIADSFKNIYGHVVVFGGSQRYAGAAHLACAAALRAGAGLVTACAPEANLGQIRADWPEIMTFPASDKDAWPADLSAPLLELAGRANALVIGPGMGRTPDAAVFLPALLGLEKRPPAVVDADALFLLSDNVSRLKAGDVITPHPGEAAGLLGITGRDVQRNRQEALDRLCALTPAAVVLKGAATLLGQGDSLRLLCPYDIPQLAIGGAGDVLSGCIAAILASAQYDGLSTLSKAALGVIRHAMAGLLLASRYPDRGIIASQLANALCEAESFVRSQKRPLSGLMPWPR